MDNDTFDRLIEETHAHKTQMFEDFSISEPRYKLKPSQAIRLEQELNAVATDVFQNGERMLMMAVRQEDQILRKKAMPERPKRTFYEDERQILVDFYQMLDLVKRDPNRKKHIHLFLTLQELKRHHLSKYFMALPDPIHLKLHDYRDIIHRPLDLRLISNKLVRGKYKDRRQFEVDMVTMIQNCKIYFIGDDQMFDVAVKFQDHFWKTYEDQEKYVKAEQIFKHLRKKCIPKRAKPKVNNRKLIRKELINEFVDLTKLSQEKIHALMVRDIFGGDEKKKVDKVNIMSLKEDQFQHLKEIVRKVGVKQPKRSKKEQNKKEKEKEKIRFDVSAQEGSQEDLYFSDDEEGPENKMMRETYRQELGQLLDFMDPGQFQDSDDDN